MMLDISNSQAPGIQANDHVINISELTRPLRNHPRHKRGLPIWRNLHIKGPVVRINPLGVSSVTAVGRANHRLSHTVTAAIPQMLIHPRVQIPRDRCLQHCAHQIIGITSLSAQLINQLRELRVLHQLLLNRSNPGLISRIWRGHGGHFHPSPRVNRIATHKPSDTLLSDGLDSQRISRDLLPCGLRRSLTGSIGS